MNKFKPCNKTKELILDRLHKSSSIIGISGNSTLNDEIPIIEILEAINLDECFYSESGNNGKIKGR
jgi:hypothetical protein